MTNDNTRTKANAVFFSVLMVLSMVAVGFAAAPAAAVSPGDERPNPNSATKNVNSTNATDTSVVFQGEDINTTGNLSDVNSLVGVSGNAEGLVLDLNSPIPQDQTPGTYSKTGDRINLSSDNPGFTILEPRISTAEVRLGGNDISSVNIDDADNTTTTTFEAYAEYNFEDAENISITVEDSSGADITGQVTPGGSAITSTDTGVGLDMTGEDAGEYTVIFEGNDDLDYGAVVEEYTITLTDSRNIQIETASDAVTQGDNLQYTVSGGTNAEQHLVTISSDEFNSGNFDGSDFAKIFRNVDDTEVRGIFNGSGQFNVSDSADLTSEDADSIDYAYAVVEMDGTQAVGSIDTSALDDSSIDIDVYNGQSSVVGDANASNYTSEDDLSFTVNEGAVALDNPTDSYIVGQDVDVSGTASSADTVGLYVRDNSDWEPVSVNGSDVAGAQEISVDTDDTFEETDVVLSDGTASNMTGSRVLSFAGRYDIGVVDMADVNDNSKSLTTSEFSTATTSRYALTVNEGSLTAEFGTVNGQIAQEDSLINVEGTASGQDEVAIAFVDRRGNTVTETTTVESDDTFSKDDISINSLDQGSVSAHVISLGRDGESGDVSSTIGSSSGDTASDVTSYIDTLSGSGDQVRSRIISNTVDADGSDDLIVSETFRLTDATISVNNVYPDAAQAEGVNPVATGETMIVEGDTNRRSDDASVTLDVLDENQDPIASGDTDEWANDGQFSISVDTSDLEPGTYVVEVDDGESSDRVNIEIVEERDTGAQEEEQAQEDTSEEQTQEDTSEDTSGGDMSEEQTQEDTSSEEGSSSSSEEGATDDSTPGFGALVALVALVAAALLATRRRDE